MARIRRVKPKGSEATKNAKKDVTEVYGLWQATFATGADSPAEEVEGSGDESEECDAVVVPAEDANQAMPPASPFRLRGKSFLFNYNWDFFGKPFPDGTPPAADVAGLWHLWKTWKNDKKKRSVASITAATRWKNRWLALRRVAYTFAGRLTFSQPSITPPLVRSPSME